MGLSIAAAYESQTVGNNDPVEYGPPAVVENLDADGAFRNIIVTWDQPDYFGHAFTEVFGVLRSTTLRWCLLTPAT